MIIENAENRSGDLTSVAMAGNEHLRQRTAYEGSPGAFRRSRTFVPTRKRKFFNDRWGYPARIIFFDPATMRSCGFRRGRFTGTLRPDLNRN
jgi:hypothetical protein